MARATPAKRRLAGDDSSKKKKQVKKNSRASTPDVITPSTAASPPPLSVPTHGKVDSKAAAKSLPPPPMNGDDMKPPTMNGSTKEATKKATPKSGKTSLAKKVVPDVDWIEDPVKSANKRKLLFAVFLIVATVLAGIMHKSIIQDLKNKSEGYLADFEWAKGQMTELAEELNTVKSENGRLYEDIQMLRTAILTSSRNQLISTYGNGPWEVEMKLQFAGDDEDAFMYITVGLDGERMPHAVYTFLSQVNVGLFEGAGFAFHHNGPHIVFASPISNHLNPNVEDTWASLESSGISRLYFQEFSPEVPHVPYTVGFSKTGPNFYINTLDNTRIHEEILDPCFGRITRGTDVVDRMHAASGDLSENSWKELEPGFAAIVSITILQRS